MPNIYIKGVYNTNGIDCKDKISRLPIPTAVPLPQLVQIPINQVQAMPVRTGVDHRNLKNKFRPRQPEKQTTPARRTER